MDIIKKKISLEQFKNRTPSIISPISVDSETTTHNNGSWGEIARPIVFRDYNNISVKHGGAMDLYYKIINIITNLKFKEFIKGKNKWVDVEYDWREFLLKDIHISLLLELPQKAPQIPIVAIVNLDEYETFYTLPGQILKTEGVNGYDYVKAIHNEIGRTIIPVEIDGIYVPYMIWDSEIDDLIDNLTSLKNDIDRVCCNEVKYEEYGGDNFLSFLQTIEKKTTTNQELTYIEIPILITSTIKDLGIYELYDEEEAQFQKDLPKKTFISGLHGESKLRTLRKRKKSISDDGDELPGILVTNDTKLQLPYQVGYVKNIQMVNNKYYGDTIVSMEENEDSTEITVTYVLGGRLYARGNTLDLDETSPYILNEGEEWDGEGIWYQETYPIYKDLSWECSVDGVDKVLTYDYIDFNEVSTTYSFEGIDFPRENYILCKDIRYQSNSYKEGATALPVFRHDNGLNLYENMKESYDVVIDRGSSAAFERHLVLSEIKTFQDLELLRNNMFNI